MPFVSGAQRRWGNSPAGKKALGSKLAEFNAASKGKKLPDRVSAAPDEAEAPGQPEEPDTGAMQMGKQNPYIKKKKGVMSSAMMGGGMMGLLLLFSLSCSTTTTPAADATAYKVFVGIEATADLALDAWTAYKQAYPTQAADREANFRALYAKYQSAMGSLESAIRAWRSSGQMVAGTEPPMVDAVNAVEALREAVVSFAKQSVPAKYAKPLKALRAHPGPAGDPTRKAA